MLVVDRQIKLSKPQLALVKATQQFPAFVGGFGSGKTEALLNRALKLKFAEPDCSIAYYLPTYDLVATVGFPRFEEKLTDMDIPYRTRTGIKPRIEIEGAGQILFRNMDNPTRIIGYEVSDSLVDELDTLKEKDALAVWQKIIARNREKKKSGRKNTIAVATTPEGFKFVYQFWKNKPPSQEYHLIKASTYDNAKHIPADYIQSLLDLYPAALVEAYVNGEFTNLTSGSVYPEFDRVLNNCNTQIIPGETLHIGQDFNVTKMASIIFVLRVVEGIEEPHVVSELNNVFDTPATVALLKQKFPNHPKIIYPDASGNARKSNNASQSDISLFEAAGMTVFVGTVNPFIKDRVTCVNAMIKTASGKRRLKVNTTNCPVVTEALEKQAYDENGEPDKSSGLDHPIDGLGYFIAYRYPIQGLGARRVEIHGL